MLSDCEEGFQGLFIENAIGILRRVVGHECSCAENLETEQLELNGKLTDESMSSICDGEPGEWGEEEVRVRALREVKSISPMFYPAKRKSENDVSSRCAPGSIHLQNIKIIVGHRIILRKIVESFKLLNPEALSRVYS